MKLWAERAPGEFVQTGAKCDRCGGDATVIGFGRRQWGEAEVIVQGDTTPIYADLCATCVAELIVWVNAGRGDGVYDSRAAQQHIEAAVRLPPLADVLRDLGLGPVDVLSVEAVMRQRGAK